MLQSLATVAVIGTLIVIEGSAQERLGRGVPDSRSPTVTHNRRGSGMAAVSLVGRVVLENGDPPGNLVQVELYCNGRIKQHTPTLPDGSFSIDVGGPRTDDWLDPSVGGSYDGTLNTVGRLASPGPGRVLDTSTAPDRVELGGCEIRLAPRPGFSADPIQLRSRDPMENPDVGVIVLRRLSNSKATTVSLNTLSAPEKARKAFEEAGAEISSGKPDLGKAARLLEKATKDYPRFSAAWELLARIQLAEGRQEEAQTSLQKAIEAEPGFLNPYLILAQLSIQASNWPDTAEWTGKVLALDHNHPTALYWSGLAHYYLSRFDRAEPVLSRLYAKGPELEEEYPFGLLPLGVIYANLGRVPEAGRTLRRYLEVMPKERVSAEQRNQLTNQIAAWEDAGLLQPKPAEPRVAQQQPK